MKVRALTFNVWFEPVHMEVRMEAIGRVVERARPAVIGFQELTRESLAMLRRQRWAKFYDCSVDVAPPCSEAYFVALFSALPVLEIHSLPFANSGMDRELVAMRVELAPGKSLVVGTSHLESMPKHGRLRVAQLQEATKLLGGLVDNSDAESVAPSVTQCLGAVLLADTNLMRADLRLMDSAICRVAGNIEVEHARSERSRCRSCDGTIPKGEVRVGQIDSYHVRRGKDVDTTLWYHQNCFLDIASANEKRVIQSYVQQLAEADAKQRRNTDEKPSISEDTKLNVTAGDREDAAVTRPAGIDLATLGLPNGWKDLWLSVSGNTDLNGLTFDGRENGHVEKRTYRNRFDRVYFYPGASLRMAFAASSQAVLENIEVVGKEPISRTLWPSDHFGVLASFEFDFSGEENSASAANTNTAMGASVAAAPVIKQEVQEPEGSHFDGRNPLAIVSTWTSSLPNGTDIASAATSTIEDELQTLGGNHDPLSIAFITTTTPTASNVGHDTTTFISGRRPVVIKYELHKSEARQSGDGPPAKKARRKRRQNKTKRNWECTKNE